MLIVVAAALINERHEILMQKRPDGRSMAGLWEFPGGKIELGEAPEAALHREIEEELGCAVGVGERITTTRHSYPFGTVSLTTFHCELVSGTPNSAEHAELRWASPRTLSTLTWAAADIPTVNALTGESGGEERELLG